ncbi:glycosyltransferase [Lactobacillus acidophilus]|uniref:glycosyltransferase n=1 Tax=Lactobacillus acidophilus TaxID=1579 RepID=UPI0021A5C7AE|nr:glycosyltransferase [Lactobacillus acidophilus]MCT3602867.1 glycosyltransferase [Lactobacillus acidophilus]MCT3623327.1 glycosyltransferase [Lactobacillus acidophilus]
MCKLSKYTVLMSVYQKENPEYLKTSIASMLAQTVKPSEFIIVEDGPLTAQLYSVINEFVKNDKNLFKIIKNEKNLGLGPSLNKGILASQNELIARMDSDDYSTPERCQKELEIFKNDPTVGIVGTFEVEYVDTITNIMSIHKVPEKNSEIRQFMKRRCAILHPTVMYKKSNVIMSGNYHSVPLYEDYDLFARMTLEYGIKAYNIQENLYYIRTSPDFYKRRGGIQYAKTALRFKAELYKKGYTSISDFIISGIGQAVVCILPNSMRKIIYNKILRK